MAEQRMELEECDKLLCENKSELQAWLAAGQGWFLIMTTISSRMIYKDNLRHLKKYYLTILSPQKKNIRG